MRFGKIVNAICNWFIDFMDEPMPSLHGYAIIYDVRGDGEDDEQYYGYFANREEAYEVFGTAFGSDPKIHNAFLVRIEERILDYAD